MPRLALSRQGWMRIPVFLDYPSFRNLSMFSLVFNVIGEHHSRYFFFMYSTISTFRPFPRVSTTVNYTLDSLQLPGLSSVVVLLPSRTSSRIYLLSRTLSLVILVLYYSSTFTPPSISQSGTFQNIRRKSQNIKRFLYVLR